MADVIVPYVGRAYRPDELESDGYPLDWHSLFSIWPGVGIKHVVRAEAEHRCVRCQHPYSGGGEWSTCDERCTHRGPVRLSYDADDGSRVERLPHDLATEAGVVVGYGKTVEARWRILTVHHLDGDKANCRWWNLVALCQRCHLQIQGKVKMDRRWLHEHSAWFRPYVAGYYAFVYAGVELTRPEVEARMNELLALEERQLTLTADPLRTPDSNAIVGVVPDAGGSTR
jgi:hypothetical protein